MNNKIVDYYTPDDERLSPYYKEHKKVLGMDKHPFGLTENGVLRFETKDTGSNIWKRYKELGGSEDETGDVNQLWREYYDGSFTMEEYMQFYREMGYSLCGYVDVWSERFYIIEDKKEFEKAIEELREIKELDKAKEGVLDTIFLATIDSVDDELIFKYRIEAKKIIDSNFGDGAWQEFIESIKNKRNER